MVLVHLDKFAQKQHKGKKSPEVAQSDKDEEGQQTKKEADAERVQGYSVKSTDQPNVDTLLDSTAIQHDPDKWVAPDGSYAIGPKGTLSVQFDKVRIEIKDQIQLYTENHLLTHPLVSPALQPSLGGLPPLLIQTGGGELLRDEQIYAAHKAAQPSEYLPPPSNNQTAEEIEAQASKYKPTHVQLQVWDDLCHVAPTLSFTRPAKHMYRGIAQFGAWALARAQKVSIDIPDDDDISFVSTDSEASSNKRAENATRENVSHVGTDGLLSPGHSEARVGRAGDSLPPFVHHMIRQRIDRHGYIYALPPKEDLEALNMPTIEVGVPKPGPVNKWMKASQQWNGKFGKHKIKIQKQRLKDMEQGFEGFDGETPPPTALAGRRIKNMKSEKAKKKSWGMALWSLWGSKHDEATVSIGSDSYPENELTKTQITREEKADQTAGQPSPSKNVSSPGQPQFPVDDGARSRPVSSRGDDLNLAAPGAAPKRSRSRRSTVTDRGQANASDEDLSKLSREFSRAAPPSSGLAEATVLAPERGETPLPTPLTDIGSSGLATPSIVVSDNPQSPVTVIPVTDGSSTRPTKGGIAYPFSLKVGTEGANANASMVTLQSMNITTPPAVDAPQHEKEMGFGEPFITAAHVEEIGRARPSVERYFTAGPGAGLFSSGVKEEKHVEESEKAERPGVERFETAREDLSTPAAANVKV
jgi:hypothetical protein